MESKKNGNFQVKPVFTVDGEQHPPTRTVKKKKPSKSAFYYYVQNFREAARKNGVLYKTMEEAIDGAASYWEKLSKEERKPYLDAAKEAKAKYKADLHNIFTEDGRSYAEVNKEQGERRERLDKMIKEVRSTIRNLCTPSALNNYPFHIIHVNYYCKLYSGFYVPCELAIAEFTILDGVKRLLHILINPGDIPLGYKHDAMKHSEQTHKIPLPDDLVFACVVQDYDKILKDIKIFLQATKGDCKLPPLYTQTTQLEPCEKVLNMLCDSINEDNIFRVYPLKEMFFELQHACIDVFKPLDESIVKFPFVSNAERELENHTFFCNEGVACEFHFDTDAVPYCSSSCVQKWSFLLLNHFHKITKILPETHVARYTNVSQNLKLLLGQRKPDVEELNKQIQELYVSSNLGASSLEMQTRGEEEEEEEALRAPKKLPEAISLLLPDDTNDEFPPLGS